MANIVYLKPRAPGSVCARAVEPSGARILFFTGVRYERIHEDGPEPARPTSGATQRRTTRRRRA